MKVAPLAKIHDGPIHLVIDSTGLKMVGDGEWLAYKHKTSNTRRSWRKLHLGIDSDGFIVATELTDSVTVEATGVVTHTRRFKSGAEARPGSGVHLTAQSVTVMAGGAIDVTAKGYSPGGEAKWFGFTATGTTFGNYSWTAALFNSGGAHGGGGAHKPGDQLHKFHSIYGDPLNPDTDGGGTLDGAEVAAGTDPFDPSDD